MDMELLEKVEKIVEKTGVTFEEAKEALNASNEDILDAIIYLEKQGKAKKPETEHYSTSQAAQSVSEEFKEAQSDYEESCKRSQFKKNMKRAGRRFGESIQKSCVAQFRVERGDQELFTVPLIVFIIALIVAFWLVGILLIVGLFCDCRYKFIGVEAATIDLNNVCDKAADACDNLKKDFQNKE